jgi:hypothetical protein
MNTTIRCYRTKNDTSARPSDPYNPDEVACIFLNPGVILARPRISLPILETDLTVFS